MPTRARRDARYCSTRCRVAAHRSRPPAEMTARNRWVRHSKGVPVNEQCRTIAWSRAENHRSYREVCRHQHGIVLAGDGLAVIDLDDCLDEHGQPAAWARNILAAVPNTWVERSRSGRGLHIWGHGHIPRGRRLRDGVRKVELYSSGRFVAVTGRTYRGPRSLASIQTIMESLIKEFDRA